VDEGKTNKFGVVTHIEILRHEFVGVCAHGAAALQIFLRRLQLGGSPGAWPTTLWVWRGAQSVSSHQACRHYAMQC